MTLKQAQKLFPDAMKAEMTIERKYFYKYNLNKQDVLLEFCSKMFPNSSILYCSLSGYKVTCISSVTAFVEESRQRSMLPGTKVLMTGAEGQFEENQKEWLVTHGPQFMCGQLVVWLDGYFGAYSCKYLKIVE